MGSAEAEVSISRSVSTVSVETSGNLVSVVAVTIDGSILWGGFRAVPVIDHEPQRRPAVEQRLREELRHHVTGQLARRAAQGLRRLLSFGSWCRVTGVLANHARFSAFGDQ
jgi:hypothetical protein